MWWFLANLDFWLWLWVVVLGQPWWWIGLWCFYCSEMDYFITLKAKINSLLQHVCK